MGLLKTTKPLNTGALLIFVDPPKYPQGMSCHEGLKTLKTLRTLFLGETAGV
jgi:hypothetical protein